VGHLLKEMADLLAQGLTGAAMALSFCKRLTQPIQERSTRPSSIGVVRTPPGDRSARADPGQGLSESPLPEAAD
jgi:hypothetical protein